MFIDPAFKNVTPDLQTSSTTVAQVSQHRTSELGDMCSALPQVPQKRKGSWLAFSRAVDLQKHVFRQQKRHLASGRKKNSDHLSAR